MQIRNPWYVRHSIYSREFFTMADKPIADDGDVTFYKVQSPDPGSVLAVRGGVAVTQCVTVAGARRVLAQREADANA